MAEPKKKQTAKKSAKEDAATSSVPVREVEAEPVEREPWSWGSFSPFGLMRRMEEDMSRLWGDFFGRGTPGVWRRTALGPRVDVFETDDQVTVKADLPGVSPEDVEINATEDTVILSGETRREEDVEEEGYFRSERSYGRFHRQVDLPAAVKADLAKASFKNGVLEIVMPKQERAKPKTVKVPIKP